MGFPMTYTRVIKRNNLNGDYDISSICGDLRRLEKDSFHPAVLASIAKEANVSEVSVKAILEVFFKDYWGLFRSTAMPDEESYNEEPKKL